MKSIPKIKRIVKLRRSLERLAINIISARKSPLLNFIYFLFNWYSFVVADLEYFLEEDFDEDKSPDRLLSICLIPSATLTAGFELNLPQNDMWALTASSIPDCVLPLLTSSLTASEHNPHSHLPSNLAFTSLIYSWVQSSFSSQHSHWTDSISISLSFSLLEEVYEWETELVSSKVMAARVRYIITGALIWLKW